MTRKTGFRQQPSFPQVREAMVAAGWEATPNGTLFESESGSFDQKDLANVWRYLLKAPLEARRMAYLRRVSTTVWLSTEQLSALVYSMKVS
ncbi:unnamed protein product [Discosporangium mesarthrocarpum]